MGEMDHAFSQGWVCGLARAGQGWIRDGEVLDEVDERPEKKMP